MKHVFCFVLFLWYSHALELTTIPSIFMLVSYFELDVMITSKGTLIISLLMPSFKLDVTCTSRGPLLVGVLTVWPLSCTMVLVLATSFFISILAFASSIPSFVSWASVPYDNCPSLRERPYSLAILLSCVVHSHLRMAEFLFH